MYGDIRELTGERLHADGIGPIDVLAGSPPCQDASTANPKGRGLDGERTGLFWEALRLVREVRPHWVLLENVPGLRTRGYDRIHDALEGAGYAVRPIVVGAWHAGAPHKRNRVWIVANAKRESVESVHAVTERKRDVQQKGCEQDKRGRTSDVYPQRISPDSNDRRRSCEEQNATITSGNESQERLSGRDSWETFTDTESIGPESGSLGVGWKERDQSQWGLASNTEQVGVWEQPGRSHGARRCDTPQPTLSVADASEPISARRTAAGRWRAWQEALAQWAHWNSGPPNLERVDDGIPKGMARAALAAYGDAVVPIIPEIIGKAIMRLEQ